MRLLPCLLAVFLLTTPSRADDKKLLTRIAFGSCADQKKPQPIWPAIVKKKPEVFLFLGDNIYADTEDMKAMKEMYAKLNGLEGYKSLKKTCPVLATWDDHDYGGNDAGAEYPKKKESQQLFLDAFDIPKDSPLRKQEGVYQSYIFGPKGKRVQIILLDTRYHRSALKKNPKASPFKGNYIANNDADATILGKAQWKWLEEQLKKPAEIRLLCSSIQIISQDHGFEKWMNFPKEREKLYKLIGDTRASGVIVLSGDRHLAELCQMEADIGYTLLDLTSSGLNKGNKVYRPLEANQFRVATMARGDNFGMVRIDWTKDDPLILLEIYDDEGLATIRHKVPLSRLQIKKKAAPPKGKNDNLAAEAKKNVGKEWSVDLVVQSTGATRTKTLVFLNSERDRSSDRNLPIVLDMKKLTGDLKTAKITNPATHYNGKKIRVTGKVELFKGSPQIKVTALKQIKVLD